MSTRPVTASLPLTFKTANFTEADKTNINFTVTNAKTEVTGRFNDRTCTTKSMEWGRYDRLTLTTEKGLVYKDDEFGSSIAKHVFMLTQEKTSAIVKSVLATVTKDKPTVQNKGEFRVNISLNTEEEGTAGALARGFGVLRAFSYSHNYERDSNWEEPEDLNEEVQSYASLYPQDVKLSKESVSSKESASSNRSIEDQIEANADTLVNGGNETASSNGSIEGETEANADGLEDGGNETASSNRSIEDQIEANADTLVNGGNESPLSNRSIEDDTQASTHGLSNEREVRGFDEKRSNEGDDLNPTLTKENTEISQGSLTEVRVREDLPAASFTTTEPLTTITDGFLKSPARSMDELKRDAASELAKTMMTSVLPPETQEVAMTPPGLSKELYVTNPFAAENLDSQLSCVNTEKGISNSEMPDDSFGLDPLTNSEDEGNDESNPFATKITDPGSQKTQAQIDERRTSPVSEGENTVTEVQNPDTSYIA